MNGAGIITWHGQNRSPLNKHYCRNLLSRVKYRHEIYPANKMPMNLHLTVAAHASSGDKILLVQEKVNGQSVLNQPAGHIEDRETPEQAVLRELKEETGWDGQVEYLISTHYWRDNSNGHTYLRFNYAVSLLKHDEGFKLDNGIEQWLWLSPDEINKHECPARSPLVELGIEQFLAGMKQAAESFNCLGLADSENG